ncbi:MAG TPA: cellulase family glycosylhydrolase [Rhodopila sp.]|nr:cellulase family glycosylhydrolase [Rhodopila sp.]
MPSAKSWLASLALMAMVTPAMAASDASTGASAGVTTPGSAAAATRPATARPTLLPAGDFSTKGNQIVDQKGRPVRLACIGWNQFNHDIPFWRQTQLMAEQGFNCIRVSWVNATMRQDLAHIDRISAAASKAGLRLILDNHTNEAGHGPRDNWGAQQKNGLWYDRGGGSDNTDGGGNVGTVTDERFTADWQEVARHYAGNSTIIGYDIRNEPQDWPGMSVWGGGSNRDIRAMYIRVGNAIQAIDQAKLIIVEPPNSDCRGIKKYPVTLTVQSKLLYSVHEYPGEISGQKISSGPALIRRMNEMWGFVINEGIGPIFVGEMGSSMRSAQSRAWAATIVPYLNGEGPDGLHIGPGQAVSTDWWAWGYLPGQNPDGTLESDWKTPKPVQEMVYSRLRQAPIGD